jgi:glycerophosphoryl diester phosphodiesterase
VIGFAHRGAAATKREQNTLSAFERALHMGARGLEADIGLTADGVPVLLHPRVALRRGPPISRLRRNELPSDISGLADLYARCGHDYDLSLDMGEPGAADAVVQIASEYDAIDRLWLTYWRLPTLEMWRERWPALHLVYATIPLGRKRTARIVAQLASRRVDAINVFHYLCRAHLIAEAHEQDMKIFAWGIRSRRALERAVSRDVDGVYCDDAAAMVDVLKPWQATSDSAKPG